MIWFFSSNFIHFCNSKNYVHQHGASDNFQTWYAGNTIVFVWQIEYHTYQHNYKLDVWIRIVEYNHAFVLNKFRLDFTRHLCTLEPSNEILMNYSLFFEVIAIINRLQTICDWKIIRNRMDESGKNCAISTKTNTVLINANFCSKFAWVFDCWTSWKRTENHGK